MASNTYNGAAYITREYQGFTQYSFDSGRTWRITLASAYKAAINYAGKK